MVLEDKLVRLATTSSIVFSVLLLVGAAALWLDRENGTAAPRIGTFDRSALQREAAPGGTGGDVLAPLAGSWAELAAEAGVDAIVERPLYLGPDVERVDVTPLLLEHLQKGDG